jgi:hypothetical protein
MYRLIWYEASLLPKIVDRQDALPLPSGNLCFLHWLFLLLDLARH